MGTELQKDKRFTRSERSRGDVVRTEEGAGREHTAGHCDPNRLGRPGTPHQPTTRHGRWTRSLGHKKHPGKREREVRAEPKRDPGAGLGLRYPGPARRAASGRIVTFQDMLYGILQRRHYTN